MCSSDLPRTPNQCTLQIVEQAIHADRIGMHSAWIGEHHFSTLGVTSCPDLLLGQVAAKTSRIRLAPAVNVLPLHHPIRVAEQWATLDLLSGGRVDFASGRGYDRNEYGPLGANFEENAAIFAEGIEIVHRLWTAKEAVIKATGKGLSQPLNSFEIDLASSTAELLLPAGRGRKKQISIFAPYAGRDYIVAVAAPRIVEDLSGQQSSGAKHAGR